MDQNLDERIRARAYAIWESEGRPEGADLDHWLRAVLELQAEEADDATAEALVGARAPDGAEPGQEAPRDGAPREFAGPARWERADAAAR